MFINTQFFTPGNNAGKSIRDAMTAASAAVSPARSGGRRPGEPGAGLVPEEYVLANPALNYAQFLLRAVLPTVLHVVIAISAGYAVGSEFRRRSMREWWDLSGRNIATALVGKLLPYYVVLMLMFVLMVGILDVWLGVSFRGNAVLTAVSATLLIVAYQMIGCLMQLLARNMAVGLSLTGIIVSPAFGFAGVGFPVLAMQDFPARLGRDPATAMVYPDPVRPGHARRRVALHGRTVRDSLRHHRRFSRLLVWLRFRSLVRHGVTLSRGGRTGDRARDARHRRDIRGRVAAGARAIAACSRCSCWPLCFTRSSTRSRIWARSCATFRSRWWTRIDSELGRALIQALEAHGNISVVLRASSYREAEDAIFARRAFAIMGIPAGYREERAEGCDGAAAGLCRFDLFHPVQSIVAGNT